MKEPGGPTTGRGLNRSPEGGWSAVTDTRHDIDVVIDERDDRTRDATRQLVAAVLDLRDAAGRTPYITTVLDTVAEMTNALGRVANISEKLERWLDVNGVATARPSVTHDNDALIKDVRRALKGLTAALAQQQRLMHDPVARAYSMIGHREGVVGREAL